MTAQRIATQLKLARSTVSGVLKRAGLSRLKMLEPVEPVQRYEHVVPGDMIHIDIKKLGRFERAGHRATGNRLPSSTGPGWEYVHVCIDDHSRVAYAEVLPNECKESAVAFLPRATKWFQRFGITIKRVLTDNGSCYQSILWHKTCEALAIKVKKTRPYRPQTNGKAERLKYLDTLNAQQAMMALSIGAQVSFDSSRHGRVFGTVFNLNRKTVSVLTDEGRQWNVSPHICSRRSKTPHRNSSLFTSTRSRRNNATA